VQISGVLCVIICLLCCINVAISNRGNGVQVQWQSSAMVDGAWHLFCSSLAHFGNGVQMMCVERSANFTRIKWNANFSFNFIQHVLIASVANLNITVNIFWAIQNLISCTDVQSMCIAFRSKHTRHSVICFLLVCTQSNGYYRQVYHDESLRQGRESIN